MKKKRLKKDEKLARQLSNVEGSPKRNSKDKEIKNREVRDVRDVREVRDARDVREVREVVREIRVPEYKEPELIIEPAPAATSPSASEVKVRRTANYDDKEKRVSKKIEENPILPKPVVVAVQPIVAPNPTATTTTTTATTTAAATATSPKTNTNATKKLIRDGDSDSDSEDQPSPVPKPENKDVPKNTLTEEERKAIRNRLEELKEEVVQWKKAWIKVKGKKPDKSDIPKPIKEKMRHYKDLEKQLQ